MPNWWAIRWKHHKTRNFCRRLFWCVEATLEGNVMELVSVRFGAYFSGEKKKNPTYGEVASGKKLPSRIYPNHT